MAIVCYLTHYHTMRHFDALRYKAVENIVRKGDIACNKQFRLFSQCFLPYMTVIFHSKCTLKCRLQFVSIWTSLKICRLVKSLYVLSNTKFKVLKTCLVMDESLANYQILPRLTLFQTTNLRLFKIERVQSM